MASRMGRSVALGLAGATLAGLVAAAAAPVASGAEKAALALSVDGAVQVTSDPKPVRGHMIPAMAVDPKNQRVLAIAEGDAIGGACTVHVSTNGGLSWRQAATPEIPPRWTECTFQNIGTLADVAFASDGTLYYAFGGYDPTTYEGQVFLARSADLGATWKTTPLPRVPRDMAKGELGLDGVPSIAVDPKDPLRVHVAWSSNWGSWTLRDAAREGKEYYWDIVMRPYVATSTDGGDSFSAPTNLAEGLRVSPEVEGVKTPPDVLVGRNGEVHVVFGERTGAGPRTDPQGDAPPAGIYVATSRDSGKTYEGKRIYSEPAPANRRTAFLWPARAASDPRTGALYVVWEQLSNAGQPVAISMMRSLDGGGTWSEPQKVNDVTPPRKITYMELFPDVSVAPNGRVDIAWYDPRHDSTVAPNPPAGANAFHDVYYTYSQDQGATWAANVRVTDRTIDRRIGPTAVGDVQGKVGVASTDRGAYIAWDDTRNGSTVNQAQDIYFTRVRLDEPGAFFSGDDGGVNPLLAGSIGLALGLAIAGGFLLVAVRRGSRLPGPTATSSG